MGHLWLQSQAERTEWLALSYILGLCSCSLLKAHWTPLLIQYSHTQLALDMRVLSIVSWIKQRRYLLNLCFGVIYGDLSSPQQLEAQVSLLPYLRSGFLLDLHKAMPLNL